MAHLNEVFLIERQEDRVAQPSHGYRAHHLIAVVAGKRFEIQVRTDLQHLWAAMSEKAADRYGHALKYGAGSAALQARLLALSEQVHGVEIGQDLLDLLSKRVATIGSPELVFEHQEAMLMSWERRRILEADLEQLAAEPDNLVGDQ